MSGPRASVFERHPRLTLLAVLALLLPILDLGFTRLYAAFHPEFYRRQSAFRVKSDVYHHGFAPNVSTELEYWGALRSSYRINSLGFRDRAVREVPLVSDKRRVVFIGDSFTEGIGVPYEQTFVGILDSALAPRGIEVLNAGAASYCPIIDYRKTRYLLEDVGLRFDELVVMIDIGDIEDETTYTLDAAGNVAFKQNRWSRESEADWYFGKPRWLASMPVYNFLRKNTLFASLLYGGLLDALSRPSQRAAQWTLDPEAFEAFGREGLAKAEEHMNLLAELLAARQIRLTVGVYPWADQIRARDLESRQVTFWREWTARHGAGFINCFPAFMEGPAEERIRREFIPGDIHWNEEGHKRIAGVVLDHFAR